MEATIKKRENGRGIVVRGHDYTAIYLGQERCRSRIGFRFGVWYMMHGLRAGVTLV